MTLGEAKGYVMDKKVKYSGSNTPLAVGPAKIMYFYGTRLHSLLGRVIVGSVWDDASLTIWVNSWRCVGRLTV